MLVCLPLLILPMSPGVELSLGYSLIPLTGLVLLLKSLLEGDYLGALPFVPPVLIVTGLCCVLRFVGRLTNSTKRACYSVKASDSI